jgi:hypothetical protein
METLPYAIAAIVALVVVWVLMNKSHENNGSRNSCGSAV